MTEDGSKIVCFTDTKGNIIKGGSLANKGETYTAVTLNIKSEKGAQIRISDNVQTNGIRLLTDINSEDITSVKNKGFAIKEIGTKIAPSDYFLDSSYCDKDFSYAITKNYYTIENDVSTIAGSIVRIQDKNLDTKFTGQGYIKIILNDNSIVTITAVLNDNSRSVYYIAGKAYADQGEYTGKQITNIKSYLDAVVIIKNKMIYSPTGYESPYIFTGKRVIPDTDICNTTASIRLVVIDGLKYYTDSDDYPVKAVITDNPESSDVTELTVKEFQVDFVDAYGNKGTDKCAILLPKTYSETGTPTRLIISCHGHNDNVYNLVHGYKTWANYFVHQGYAVMMVDGGAASTYNCGCSAAVESNIAAYNYVMNTYNLYTKVFVHGRSMGGMTSMNLVCSDKIPVIAHVQESPILSLYRQLYCYGWTNENVKLTSSLYKFSYNEFNSINGTDFTYLTFPYSNKEKTVNDLERQLFQLNFDDKIVPVCNICKYCPQFFNYDSKTFKAGFEDFLSATDDERISELYNNIEVNYPVPVKIYHGKNEGTVPYVYSDRFVTAVNEGYLSGEGSKAELVTYDTTKHCSLGEEQTVYCKDGSVMMIQSSFINMLEYFRSFE